MAKRKQYKVGDRIFLEDWNTGGVFDCIVTDVKPRSNWDSYKKKYIDYNMLYTGPMTATEDYNCLSEKDPRVVEYKKTHPDPRVFVKKFETFLKENNFDLSQNSIKEYLYNLVS